MAGVWGQLTLVGVLNLHSIALAGLNKQTSVNQVQVIPPFDSGEKSCGFLVRTGISGNAGYV